MDYKRLLEEIDLRIHVAHTCWDDTDPDYGVTMTLNEAVEIRNLLTNSRVTEVINILNIKFTNIARKHVGKKLNEVPELVEILKAIELIEKHCNV